MPASEVGAAAPRSQAGGQQPLGGETSRSSRELPLGCAGLVLASREPDLEGEASCWTRENWTREEKASCWPLCYSRENWTLEEKPHAGLVLASRELGPGGEGLVLASCYSRKNWAREEKDSARSELQECVGPSAAILHSGVWAFGRAGKPSVQDTDTGVIKCKGPGVLSINFCKVSHSEASKDSYRCTMS